MIIVSRDKDLQQLLSDRVSLLDPGDGTLRGPQNFRDEFGFEPSLFPDYQAFTGDSVDNIPGIRGVGPKAAGALIRRFGPLESVYEAAEAWGEAGLKPGGKVAQRLVEERDYSLSVPKNPPPGHRNALVRRTAGTKLERGDAGAFWHRVDEWQLRDGLGSALVRAVEDYLG